jgi:hypothetical protein
MYLLDLEYSKQQFLVVLYESVLEEIGGGLSHGNVVRHLVKDGSKISDAEELYQYISNHQNEVRELIAEIKKSIALTKQEYDTNQSKQMVRAREIYQNEQKETEILMMVGENLVHHAMGELLKHLLKSIL